MEVKPVSPVFVDQALDRYIAACLKMFALLDGQLAIAWNRHQLEELFTQLRAGNAVARQHFVEFGLREILDRHRPCLGK